MSSGLLASHLRSERRPRWSDSNLGSKKFDIRTDASYNSHMGYKNNIWQNETAIRAAFDGAQSIKEILISLGEPLGSANYSACKRYAARYSLEVPIFVRTNLYAVHSKNRIPLTEILVEHSEYSGRQSLKKRLISELGWIDRCMTSGCPNPQPIWNGRPLVLQLEHINGVGDDNRLENLAIICPNCHTQTNTFANRNPNKVINRYFCECGNEKGRYSLRCKSCASKLSASNEIGSRKPQFNWPPIEEVIMLIKETNYSQAARTLGCSDHAIRKLLVRNNIDLKTLERFAPPQCDSKDYNDIL